MSKPTICVVGMGYIGLPTAIIFANKGFHVVGCDINPKVVEAIRTKKPLIHEPGLLERLAKAVDSGNLTTDVRPKPSDVFIIAVPTPVHHDTIKPDLTYVISATKSILPLLAKGNMVILESTVPPGTTESVVGELIRSKGLIPGSDVDVAHAPEKAIPGKVFFELENNDRVVGGLDERSAQRAENLYRNMTKGRLMRTDATTAEMVKLMENTYRDVNIALANEFALLGEKLGVDIWKVIEYANHHPRVNVHQPGPGVGGHCIAVDPWFLVDAAPDIMRLVRMAREINDGMPSHTVQRIKHILASNKVEKAKVTLLGLAFKANIDDIRESPSITICQLLQKEGIDYSVFDPKVQGGLVPGQARDLSDALQGSDLIVLLVAHDEFNNIDPMKIAPLLRHKVILDMKNVVDKESYKEAGFETHLLGCN
jgi:UDP-N-acetyl-D-mannosaminuronic acid dehydrogenase